MTSVSLIQCDTCPSHCDREHSQGWSTFTYAWLGQSLVPERDVCPECRRKLENALDSVLNKREQVAKPTALESIATVEQRHIMAVLTLVSWNKSRAARLLGIQRTTLNRKLKSYKATEPEKAASTEHEQIHCPDCGEVVETLFDHVDRDEKYTPPVVAGETHEVQR
jgi:DNA-binding protein Fis